MSNHKKVNTLKIALPLIINGAILYYYIQQRGIKNVLLFNLGDVVVFGTLAIISTIALLSIIANERLYEKIRIELNLLKDLKQDAKLFVTISEEFQHLRKHDGINDVNIPSFLEEKMSEYSITMFKQSFAVTKVLKIIQTFISMTILIGVLGTFIGLIIALKSIDGSASGNVLEGINTAFYTSIAGIISSLLINLVIRFQNSDQLFIQLLLRLENLMYAQNKDTSEREIVHTLEKVVTSIQEMKQSFIDLSTFSTHFQESAVKLEAFNKDFEASTSTLKNVFTKMDNTVTLFEARTRTFHDDFQNLFTYLHNTTENQQQSTAQIADVTTAIQQLLAMNEQHRETQNAFLTTIAADVHASHEAQTKILTDTQQKTAKQYTKISSVIQEISNQHTAFAEQHVTAVTKQNELATQNKEQLILVEQLTKQLQIILDDSHFNDLHEITQLFNKTTNDSVASMEKIANTIQSLEQQTTSQNDSFIQVAKLFTDSAKQTTKNHEKIVQNIDQMQVQSGELRQQLANVVTVFHQYGNNEALLTQLSSTMTKTFTNNYEVIAKQNEELKAALQHYLSETSSILNGQLSQMIQQFNTFLQNSNQQMDNNLKGSIEKFKAYIDTTNKLMDTKLAELIDNKMIFDQFAAIMLNEMQQKQGGINHEQSV